MPKYVDVESLHFPNICIFDMTLHGATVPMVRLVDLQKLIPAADVKPVKRGEWIGYPECLKYPNAYADTHIVCSVCEECFSMLDNDTERFDFCPHCGAVMNGGQDGTA